MRLQIELTEEQLQLIINALEINFRIMMPQQGSIVADLLCESVFPQKDGFKTEKGWENAFTQWLEKRDCSQNVLDAVGKMIFGGCADYKNPKDCNRLSDIWSALRHVQYEVKPTDTWDVRSGKPFRMSDYPMIKCEVMKDEET